MGTFRGQGSGVRGQGEEFCGASLRVRVVPIQQCGTLNPDP